VGASDIASDLQFVREAFPRTIRLVSSARLRATVLAPLADNPEELDLLAELEGATSGRLISEHRGLGTISSDELVHGVPHAKFINASFAYAKPREPNRFNPASRGAWYSALARETCIAEVGYHLTKALSDAGDFNAVVDYTELLASMSGVFVDLRESPDHQALNPNPAVGYPAGNGIAALARAEGHNGIIYPSVRHQDGTCIVALWPNVVQSVTQGSIIRLVWNGTPGYRWEVP
jgi:RES domain-containing protein